jgi:hypothetical protein
MNVPMDVIVIFLGCGVALQGWMLQRIFSLEKKVTAIAITLSLHLNKEVNADTDHITQR